MQYFGQTDIGNIRSANEDSFQIKLIKENILAAVVADGMGGHVGGHEASSFAVESAMKAIDDAAKFFPGYTDKQIEGFLKNTSIKINKNLYQKASARKELSGMGTTLVICIISGNRYYVSNIGDSRLYICTDSLTQVTRDHSYVSELVDMGMITKEQALNHPNKNVITRAVGSEPTITADIFTGKLLEGQSILMCSDGLTNMVDEDEITQVLVSDETPENQANSLVNLAKQNGGKDNITVVIIKNQNGGGIK